MGHIRLAVAFHIQLELARVKFLVIDRDKKQLTCPQEQVSLGWYPAQTPCGEPLILA
jgi:hypothetical protein